MLLCWGHSVLSHVTVLGSLCAESSSALVDQPAWKNTASFSLGATQMAWLCTGTEFGFVWGILNFVRIRVLSTYRTVRLASVLGHIDDAIWKLEEKAEAVCFRLYRFVFLLCVRCENSC